MRADERQLSADGDRGAELGALSWPWDEERTGRQVQGGAVQPDVFGCATGRGGPLQGLA